MPSTTPGLQHRHRRLVLTSRRGAPSASGVGGRRRSAATLRRKLARPSRVPASARHRRRMRAAARPARAAAERPMAWGEGPADSMSGGNGSLVRACARSRSFREVEENNRLRFGLAPAARPRPAHGLGRAIAARAVVVRRRPWRRRRVLRRFGPSQSLEIACGQQAAGCRRLLRHPAAAPAAP